MEVKTERITLPLSIQPLHENEPPVVVHPDGFFANSPYSSYMWEHQLREMITGLGLNYQTTWSVRWWKNPSLEARKLASQIIKQDAQFKPILPQVPELEGVAVEDSEEENDVVE